jgi:hypothetical protein
LRDFGINLPPQQRSCFQYRAMNRLFVIKLASSRIEQRDYVVHPFAWPYRAYLRDGLCRPEVSAHSPLQIPSATASADVTGTSLNSTKRLAFDLLSCHPVSPTR